MKKTPRLSLVQEVSEKPQEIAIDEIAQPRQSQPPEEPPSRFILNPEQYRAAFFAKIEAEMFPIDLEEMESPYLDKKVEIVSVQNSTKKSTIAWLKKVLIGK